MFYKSFDALFNSLQKSIKILLNKCILNEIQISLVNLRNTSLICWYKVDDYLVFKFNNLQIIKEILTLQICWFDLLSIEVYNYLNIYIR